MNILHSFQESICQLFSPKKMLCLGAMLLGGAVITPTESSAQWLWGGSHIYNANIGQGNVGIGVTTPSVDLHIKQDGVDAPTAGFSLSTPNTNILGELLVEQTSTAHTNFSLQGDLILRALPDVKVPGGNLILTNKSAGKNVYVGTTSIGALKDSPRMTVLHNGNIGIGNIGGIAPLEPVGIFSVENQIILQSGGWPFIGFNAYWGTYPANQSSGIFANRRIANGPAAGIVFDRYNGNLHFQVVPTGAAGSPYGNTPTPVNPPDPTFALTIANSGNIGIGVENPKVKLAVDGLICAKEIRVSEEGAPCWPDFVFEDNYKLLTLEEIEHSIKKNKHLPGIPSAAEVKSNGIELGDMQAKLLQKIEEMTLYMIDMKKNLSTLQKENETLKEQITAMQKQGR